MKFLRWCKDTVALLRPELAIDFQGLFRSAWIGRASRAKRFVGLPDAREGAVWFYHHLAPAIWEPTHAVQRYLAAADHAIALYNSRADGPNSDDPIWTLPEGQPVDLDDNVTANGYILLHPFARGEGKSLSPSEIRQVCRQIAPRRVVLVGQYRGASITNLPTQCLDLSNRTSLSQLIWLIRRSMFVITVDSGPAHLAAALQRPMVSIHTWSDPRLVGPFWDDAWVWKNRMLLQVKELSGAGAPIFDAETFALQPEDLERISALATSS